MTQDALFEETNRPFEPYRPKKIIDFEDAKQVFKETSPAYSALLKRARHLCYKYTYVDADLLRENSLDIEVPEKRIYGSVLRNKCFSAGGYVASRVKESHGRPIRRFRLKEGR